MKAHCCLIDIILPGIMYCKFVSKYIFPGFAVLFFLTGCVREEFETAEGMEIHLKAKVGTVLVGTASTKADVGFDYDYGESLEISVIRWDASDENNEPSGRSELSAVMGVPAQDGSWSREIDVTPTQFYEDRNASVGFVGWYPKSVEGSGWVLQNGRAIHDDNTMLFDIDGKTDVMVSTFGSGNYSSGVEPLEFKHALSLYNIYVYAVDAIAAERWGKLNSLTLRNLPSQVKVVLPADITDSGNFSFSPAGDETDVAVLSGASLELQPGSPTVEGAVRIGTILGGSPADGVLGIKAVTSEESSGNSVSIARNFQPGHAYNIFLRFSSRGIINAEVSSSEWKYDENKEYQLDHNFNLLTDLSRYGTSNSYIVSSANRGYCFTGNVKGNGTAGNTLEDRDGNVITLDADVSLKNVASVKIVRSDAVMKKSGSIWEFVSESERADTTLLIDLMSNTLSDGRVIFRVPGNLSDPDDQSLQYKGNAKIAAFDQAGDIVWSWHIWVTDRPQNQGYSNGYVALDRNLGAVTSSSEDFEKGHIASAGLYYQWGRKDPMFPAPINDGSQWGDVDDAEHPVSLAGPVSVDESVSHPMTFYYDESGNNWTDDPDSRYFWGFVSEREDIRKTIYDPCPPGYRVPGNPLWEDYSEEMTSSSLGESGYMFDISDAISIYYPCTSCIVTDGGVVKVSYTDMKDGSSGNYVYLSSATPYEPSSGQAGNAGYEGLAYHFRYVGDMGEDYSSVMTADPSKHYVKRSDAYPVRCVFENSAPVVTDLSETQTANCYVVSGTGYYKFRTDVRGNGVTTLNVVGSNDRIDIAPNGESSTGAVEKVDILWWQGDLKSGSRFGTVVSGAESMSGDELDSYIDRQCPVTVMDNGSVDDGYAMIYVRSNANTAGNVGLAAYDSEGDILWSWHIWICPDLDVVTMGNYTLMDRNIGATFVPGASSSYSADNMAAAHGFCYQWGRKDPFFQPDFSSSGSTRNVTAPWFGKSYSGNWTLHRSNLIYSRSSINVSWARPLEFFSSDQNTWQTTYDSGEGGAVNNLWGYVASTGEGAGSSFAKTMYDPCPPGYRVMQHDVFESANVCLANDESERAFARNNEYGIYLENGLQMYEWRFFNWRIWRNVVSGNIWFPNSPAIASDGTYNSPDIFRLNTSTAFEGDTPDATREIRWRKERVNIGHESDAYIIQQKNKENWQTDGRAVRCQME